MKVAKYKDPVDYFLARQRLGKYVTRKRYIFNSTSIITLHFQSFWSIEIGIVNQVVKRQSFINFTMIIGRFHKLFLQGTFKMDSFGGNKHDRVGFI